MPHKFTHYSELNKDQARSAQRLFVKSLKLELEAFGELCTPDRCLTELYFEIVSKTTVSHEGFSEVPDKLGHATK